MNRKVLGILLVSLVVSGLAWAHATKKTAAEINISDFQNSRGEQGLIVNTRIPANEWAEMGASDKGPLVVQVRLYQQDEGGVKKEILNKDSLILSGPVDEIVLDPEIACASLGNKTLFVWLSVRFNRMNLPRNESYENLETPFSYQCLATADRQNIEMQSEPKLALVVSNDHSTDAKTYGLGVDYSVEQFRNLKKSMRSPHIKLFVYREIEDVRMHKNKPVRVQIGRPLVSTSAKPADFAVPLKGLCDEAAIYWADIYEKKVQVGCEISVVHDTDGARDFKYNSFSCPKWDVICPSK